MKRVSLSETGANIPFNVNIKKEEAVLLWLLTFRRALLDEKKGDIGDLMPSKIDIARYLKVSTGTIQNAMRYAEDMGYFVSKQCIGTMIADKNAPKPPLKMFSKKDKTVIEIKKFIISHKYETGEIIPKISELAAEIKTSPNTVRLAIFELVKDGILKKQTYGRDDVIIYAKEFKLTRKEKISAPEIKNENLSVQIIADIEKYITENYNIGDKIPTNEFFAKMFSVSARTVNLAMKELNKDKIILSRRGRYGSTFLNKRNDNKTDEKSIFMSKPKSGTELKISCSYKWEETLKKLTKYILKNYEAGDKIPAIKVLARTFCVSTTTIKRALKELVKEEILYIQRGKYGGIFINAMPQKEDAYTWLAINPEVF